MGGIVHRWNPRLVLFRGSRPMLGVSDRSGGAASLGVVAKFGEQRHGLVGGSRAVVAERRRFHRCRHPRTSLIAIPSSAHEQVLLGGSGGSPGTMTVPLMQVLDPVIVLPLNSTELASSVTERR